MTLIRQLVSLATAILRFVAAWRARNRKRGLAVAFCLIGAASVQAVDLDFSSVPLRVAADAYGKLAGLPVLVGNAVEDDLLTVKGSNLSTNAALELIAAAFEVNGWAMDCTSNFCKVVAVDDWQPKPAATPEPEVRTGFYRLKHAKLDAAFSLLGTNFAGQVERDDRQRMLLVTGTKLDIAKATARLDEIDRPLRTVIVEAIITEVAISTNSASGINVFQRVLDAGAGAIAGGSQGTAAGSGQPVNLTSAIPTPANVIGNGTLWLTLKGLKIDVLLKLLDSDSAFKVLSKPILSLLDGEQASLSIGQQRPYVTQTVSQSLTGYSAPVSSTNGLNQLVGSTVGFLDLSLSLKIKAQLSSDDTVKLLIDQVAADFGGEISLPTGPVAIVNRRSLSTTTLVRSGDTILLGGLIRSDDSRNSEGIPGLRKIPIAGKAFGESSHKVNNSELLVFLRATIQESESVE